MFFNVLEYQRYEVLNKIVKSDVVGESYLAGGTGLALQLGHRVSEDFDFFSPVEFSGDDIIYKLEKVGDVNILYSSKDTLHLLLDGVRVTWLYYSNPLLDNLVIPAEIKGLRIASKKDIGVMKLVAISSRGTRKDFIDLYCICQSGIELDELFKLLPQKFPNKVINLYHILISLCYFDDAENEAMPKMLIRLDWDDVKKFFLDNCKKLIKLIE
ncbi:nucleotidyl transferase AbiEii/AbiGii toxin family protein [Caldicellulosiruptor morganii]|uniref:Nucleotidyl transferase AbiEii/AbiGii toxin family protein n=1 Tax=Caldicellulosiruptor morganii TaxID=1387555 RepID=A0ABY7BMF0_9FIRM|nr:nucleotidyl transferase AbiEii/AbiGii toxin family protein [Caldicellulosiruptor morganii]WAM33994.1 nucleotidyl transferase AbiEii/AbiGii toxin family protein [Caldicellulosiruptor morganii]